MNFFVDLANVFNEPQTYSRGPQGYEDRLERSMYNGTAISFGVSGTF